MPVRRRRCGSPRLRTPLALLIAASLIALALACCAPTPPPPAPAAAAPLPLPPPPPAEHPVLRAAWSFQATQDTCVALAKAGPASLRIAIRPDGLIRLILSLPGQTGARPVARFSGPAGHWQMEGALLPARRSTSSPATSSPATSSLATSSLATFSLARNDTSLGRILMLLSGGLLELGPPESGLPILALPESGDDGRQWFVCARRSVTGT